MRLSTSMLAASLLLATSGAMAHHDHEANHKRFVVARRALPPINVLGGLLSDPQGSDGPAPASGNAAAQAYSGKAGLIARDPLLSSSGPSSGPNSNTDGVNLGDLLSKAHGGGASPQSSSGKAGLLARDPLLGGGVPGSDAINVGTLLGSAQKTLARRQPLAALPLNDLAGALPLGQTGGSSGASSSPSSSEPPKMIGVSQLGQTHGQQRRDPLAGGSLGGVTSELGLNSKGNKDSLVPISLGGRATTATGNPGAALKTVQDATSKIGNAKAKLTALFGSGKAATTKPTASKEAIIRTFQHLTEEIRDANGLLHTVQLSHPPSSSAAAAEARALNLPGLLADLITTVNGLLNVLEPPLKQLLSGLLGAVADSLKPYAGQLINSLNSLLVTVEGIVLTLGLQLGPILQPVLNAVRNLAQELGITLQN